METPGSGDRPGTQSLIPHFPFLTRIVSGGQTGVDRAALDVALTLDLPVGGWCPAGRWTEDGRLPDRYPLTETDTPEPRQRTRLNVQDTDATLILSTIELVAGTLLTARLAQAANKPCIAVNPASPDAVPHVRAWLVAHEPRLLNLAGPRETEAPGIYDLTHAFIHHLLTTS